LSSGYVIGAIGLLPKMGIGKHMGSKAADLAQKTPERARQIFVTEFAS